MLSEHFSDLVVYRLTEPASVQYQQVAVLGVRRKRHQHIQDSALLEGVRWLEMLATKADLEALGDSPTSRYEIPDSGPVVLSNAGIPLDAVEDLLPESSAYRQASRGASPQTTGCARPAAYTVAWRTCRVAVHRWNAQRRVRRRKGSSHRPLAVGEITDHWEEQEEDGTKILHDRERFSHELTLVFADGETQILTHEKKESP